jgi:hypothetical protein
LAGGIIIFPKCGSIEVFVAEQRREYRRAMPGIEEWNVDRRRAFANAAGYDRTNRS